MATNEELVARYQRGEDGALMALYRQNTGLAQRLGLRYAGFCASNCAVGLDDLRQEAFLAVAAAAKSYDPAAGQTFAGWLALHLKQAFRKALGLTGRPRLEHYQKTPGDEPLPEDGDKSLFEQIADPATDPTTPEAVDRMQKRFDLEAALARLPVDEAQAVHLRYLDELTPEQTAARLGLDRHRATRTIQRGIGRLRNDGRLRLAYLPDCFRLKSLASFRSDFTSAVEAAAEAREQVRRNWEQVRRNWEHREQARLRTPPRNSEQSAGRPT